MYIAREAPLQRLKLGLSSAVLASRSIRARPMWRTLRNLALRIGNNEDFRELTRGVAMAFGWLIVSAIVVLIAAIIVSALF
jgi:hypothetical protein